MDKQVFKICFAFMISLFWTSSKAQDYRVNAIIGDVSWIRCFDEVPNSASDENLRISTHLNYVVDLLKKGETTPSLILKRIKGIALLEEYINNEVYPQPKAACQTRRPCFIDENSNLCAVGYLIAKTKGIEEAQRINNKYQNNYLLEMQDSGLVLWQQQSGFTLKELAMIQPTYRRIAPLRFQVYNDFSSNLYGIIDSYNNKRTTKPIYKKIIPYAQSNHLFIVLYKGGWGLINAKGEIVIDTEYEEIKHFNTDRQPIFLAHFNDGFDIYDSLSNVIAEIENGRLISYHLNFMVIEENGKQGLMDLKGNRLIDPMYKNIRVEGFVKNRLEGYPKDNNYNRTLFVVQNEDLNYGVLNYKGETLIPIEFSRIERKHFFWMANKNHKTHSFSLLGDPWDLGHISKVERLGYNYNRGLQKVYRGSLCGVVDRQGKWQLPQKYTSIDHQLDFTKAISDSGISVFDYYFKEFIPPNQKNVRRWSNFFLYNNDSLFGVKKIDGSYFIPEQKDSVKFAGFNKQNKALFGFKEKGEWHFKFENGKTINLDGVTSFEFFQRELLKVTIDKKNYLAPIGRDILTPILEIPFKELKVGGNDTYWIRDTDAFVLIKFNSNHPNSFYVLSPTLYDSIYPDVRLEHDNIYLAKKDNKYGLLTYNGSSVLPFEYEEYRLQYYTTLHKKGIFFLKNNKWYYFSMMYNKLELASEEITLLLNESEHGDEINNYQIRLIKKKDLKSYIEPVIYKKRN